MLRYLYSYEPHILLLRRLILLLRRRAALRTVACRLSQVGSSAKNHRDV
jgi:hypothetical protein